MERDENTVYVLSLSYGKDSIACLGAIETLGLPLDRIVHAEVWFDDSTPADLPPMVEFKKKADAKIKERFGITVEHYRSELTYLKAFYTICGAGKIKSKSKNSGKIYGFPFHNGPWCNSRLKVSVLNKIAREFNSCVQYIGIASDEQNRFHVLSETKISPLVLAGWNEQDCKKWCIDNDLLSPIYTTSTRGGCWFCHNQGTDQLRILRKEYPDLWKRLLDLDTDSPSTFKADGHTVRDFDRRFQAEDNGEISAGDKKFRWSQIDCPYKQISMFDLEGGKNGGKIDVHQD